MLKTLYHSKSRHATWLELFFDLVFVAVIGAINHDLAHTHEGHINANQLLRFPLVFIPVWWIWATHTLYANRFDNDSRSHRLFALLIMALLVFTSTFIKNSHDQSSTHFIVLYTIIRFMLAIPYILINIKYKDKAHFSKGMFYAIFLGALISLSSIMIDHNFKFIIFYGGILTDMILQILLRHKTKKFPVHKTHLIERTGLLAIIILGESLISIVGNLSNIVQWDCFVVISSIAGLAMLWSIWWIYFDSFNKLERAKRITNGNVLIYTHLILCIGLMILSDLIGYSIKHDLDQETFRILSIVGMCSFYLGKQVIYYFCFPPYRNMIIINTVVCVVITIISTFLPRIEYSLIGITFAMILYVYSTIKWLLPNNIDKYLDREH